MSKKIIWITGGSSGIGFATAKLLAQNNYIVYAGSRNPYGCYNLEQVIQNENLSNIE